MGMIIGIDEAGYGPNLGPLVISATVWEVPGDPRKTNLRELLCEAVRSADERRAGDSRICIDDSKRVHSAGKGLHGLETGVLATLASLLPAARRCPETFQELCWMLADGPPPESDEEFWLRGRDRALPADLETDDLQAARQLFANACTEANVKLRAIRSDIVLTHRFNRMINDCGTKGLGLSRTTMRLLRSVWDPESDEDAWIICDKHGGRNRYDELLENITGDHMIFRVEEGRERSIYRIGPSEIRFQTKAETHLPVALASMVSKYVRELAMDLFNEFWQEHVPDLKPTRGYPVDAKRFRADIRAAQQRLSIRDEALWRAR